VNNLPKKMTAVVNHGPENFKIEKVDTPLPEKEELILSMKYCGICASDIKAYFGADRFWGGEDPFIKTPVIPGHEFVGEVAALGEDAKDRFNVELGDKAVAEPLVPCGKCLLCRKGKYWMCEEHNIYGFKGNKTNGGMAEYIKIKANSKVYKLPDGFPDEKMGALIEPFANGLHAVKQGNIEFDDVVVLAGAGSIGLSMVQFISLKTPKKLIVLDLDNARLKLAKELGADICLNPGEDDVVGRVKKMTEGYGCDIFIEGTGSPEGVKLGLEMLRRAGTMVEFSVFSEKTDVDWSVISVKKELNIKGAHLTPYTYPPVIDLFERSIIKGDQVITHTFSLEEFEKAIETAKTDRSIKVLIHP